MLAFALVLAVLSAVAYGGATAVQHGVAHTGADRADARGLLALLRSPRWWLSIGGDAVGLVLQVTALATGPVVLIQPVLVLSLPVALPLRGRLGGPAPVRRDWLAVAAVILGLGGFLLLVGDPAGPRLVGAATSAALAAVALVGAGLVLAVARSRRPVVKAVVFGAVSGALYAVVAVLIDGTSEVVDRHGFGGLLQPAGAVPVLGVIGVGAAAMTVTQLGFQVGALGASFPASLVIDPVVAVVLGTTLLHERVPTDALHLVGYLLTLAVVAAATIELANPRPAAAAVHPRTRKDGVDVA